METSKILAEAVLKNAYIYDVTRGMNAYNECTHCGAFVYWDEPTSKMEHDSECPVLIAEKAMSV